MDAENWTRACSILSLFLSKFDTVCGFSHLDLPSTYCMTYWKRAYARHLQGRIQKFWTGRGVHNIIGPRITVNQLSPLFESLVVASLWKFVLHSGVQPCIRLYGDTHRMKQYLLFRLKSATQCIIPYEINYYPACMSHEQIFLQKNIKWHIFLDFCCCCNANMYSKLRTSFLREATLALSKMCELILVW